MHQEPLWVPIAFRLLKAIPYACFLLLHKGRGVKKKKRKKFVGEMLRTIHLTLLVR